jgi:flavin-dependent dehydrogenase
MIETDITVIGAGPAGSLAAILLARGGQRVILVEQHRFPRDKVCGECLSALGLKVLQRTALRSSVARLGAIELRRTTIHASDGSSTTILLEHPMWGLTRSALDAGLLDEARSSGVMVIQPARCESVEPGARPGVRIRRLDDNAIEQWRSRWVIVADGKAGLLPNRPAATKDFGIKGHFENIAAPADAIQLFGVNRSYGGIAPVEGGRWNLAFSVPGDRLLAHCGNVADLMESIFAENDALSQLMRDAIRCGPWLSAPLPRFAVAPHWPDGIIPIGNAAAAVEPIGGEGMGLALRSAELAAAAIQYPAHSDGHNIALLRNQFDRLWRIRRVACRAAAMGMSRPALAEVAVSAAANCRQLTTLTMRCMGKQ